MFRTVPTLGLGCVLAACTATPVSAPPSGFRAVHGVGDEIVVAGERISIGAPVVLWWEPPFYSAYERGPRFSVAGPVGARYTPGRRVVDPDRAERAEREGMTLGLLREVVDQLVLHYDACGTSRACFRVLQDRRQLSVHFLLDVDGTIYQTLDLRDQAWHARQANPRSIGVEIAQAGCFAPGAPSPLDEWYREEGGETRLRIPARYGDGGVRTRDFIGRPARPGRVEGEINGVRWEQYDFTPEQYDSLVKLAAALVDVFPRLRPDAPRDSAGAVRTDVLSEGEFAAFSGILGHYHVSRDKRDPGPAFDWEGFLAAVRARGRNTARAAADPDLHFVFVTTCAEADFFRPVRKGVEDAAAAMGVRCDFVGTPGVDVPAQVELVRRALDEGCDGIALNIIDPVAFDAVVEEAAERGVPVVAFNVDDHATENARLSAVCQSFHEAGRTLAEHAGAFLAAGDRILMTLHDEGVSALDDRLRGAQEVLAERGITWRVVVTGSDVEAGVDVVARALRDDPEIRVVLCTGQADTTAAGLAIEREFAATGRVAAGFDLSPEILRLVRAGHLRFTIDQQPYVQGFYPVVQLTLLRRHGIAPSSMDAGAGIIDRANVDDVREQCARGYR